MSDEKKYIPSTIPPGNCEAKILSFDLKLRPFKTKEGNDIWDLILNLETKPLGGKFQGFKKDFNDPNSERYLGQVARVRYAEWGYSDGTTTGGNEVVAEKEILRSLKSLCIEIGQLNWFQNEDEKLPTAADLVKKINEEGLFKDHYLYWCLASRQYVNKRGYATDDLYLPRYSKEAGKPFSKKMDDLAVFNSTIHVMKPKNAPAKTAAASNTQASGQTSMDMGADPQNNDLGKSKEFIDENNDLPF